MFVFLCLNYFTKAKYSLGLSIPLQVVEFIFYLLFVVLSLSGHRLFTTPWTAACQASISFTNSQSLLKLMSFESVMPSNHLILCCPLLLPSIFPSISFSNELALRISWPKYWSFRFSISPSSEYSALISFTIDWFDLLAVQGTFTSLLCCGLFTDRGLKDQSQRKKSKRERD